MSRIYPLIILASILLSGCNSSELTSTPIPITVQYTPATVPWLEGLYGCAAGNTIIADERSAAFIDLNFTDMAIRIGTPEQLDFPVYQIGSEDVLVVVNPQNPVKFLTTDEVQGIFSGRITNWEDVSGADTQVQVWVYSSGEDVQQIFEQTVLRNSLVITSARLATSPDEMAQAISDNVNAIGILTHGLKDNNESTVFSISNVPVLALTPTSPPPEVQNLLACMQK